MWNATTRAPGKTEMTRASVAACSGVISRRSAPEYAGTNQIWMFTAFDVNGRERIKNGVVDVGYLEALKVEQGIVVRFY